MKQKFLMIKQRTAFLKTEFFNECYGLNTLFKYIHYTSLIQKEKSSLISILYIAYSECLLYHVFQVTV